MSLGFIGCAGPVGPAGAPGAAGEAGKPGDKGAGGTNGTSGTNGTDGPVGPKGADAVLPPAKPTRELDAGLTWYGTNAAKLNALLAAKGNASATYKPSARPVATFDWDNTIVKNDIGDATFFWMMRHDKILQPTGKDWSLTSKDLTAAALLALNTACDSLAAVGDPLPTSTNAACADQIFSIYDAGVTKATTSPMVASAAAWITPITLTNNTAYTWAAQLQAGYTATDVRAKACTPSRAPPSTRTTTRLLLRMAALPPSRPSAPRTTSLATSASTSRSAT